MNLNEFQKAAVSTSRFGPVNHPLVPNLLRSLSYVGKIAERFKKAFRDNDGTMTDEQIRDMRSNSRLFTARLDDAIYDLINKKKPTKFSNEFVYPAIGLVGESGEVAEKLAEIIETGMTTEKREEVINEVGDVLWYVAAVSHTLGYTLEEVADRNLAKLKDRQSRNKIHGSGDNR